MPGKTSAVGRISVVICVYTQERWDDILAAVDSVLGQSSPAHELIVVVDHNRALRHRLLARLAGACQRAGAPPAVMVVPNSHGQGLSGGKNTGVAVATGDVVAFLDDDAVAEPDWLKFLADNYTAAGVAGVGGMTLPRWDTRRPAWFPGEFDWVVGCNYAGMPPSRQPVRNLLGGNASFRRQAFEVAGGFASGVGRSAGRLPLGCEETEFCIRLRQLRPDLTLLIEDRAVIWHRVRRARCRFSYFISRCYAEGVSKARVSASVGASDGTAAERRYVLTALPAGITANLAAALHGDPWGLGRAGAILAGVAAATAGYAAGGAGRRRD
jgi:GT2 family glycosyltransferase